MLFGRQSNVLLRVWFARNLFYYSVQQILNAASSAIFKLTYTSSKNIVTAMQIFSITITHRNAYWEVCTSEWYASHHQQCRHTEWYQHRHHHRFQPPYCPATRPKSITTMQLLQDPVQYYHLLLMQLTGSMLYWMMTKRNITPWKPLKYELLSS